MQKLKSWFLSVFYGSGGAFMNFPAAVAFGLFAVIVQFIAFPIGTDEDLYKALMLACITGITSNIMFSLIFKRSRLEGCGRLRSPALGSPCPARCSCSCSRRTRPPWKCSSRASPRQTFYPARHPAADDAPERQVPDEPRHLFSGGQAGCRRGIRRAVFSAGFP